MVGKSWLCRPRAAGGWPGLLLVLAFSNASAHPICIRCGEPQISVWCDIDRSDKIENLPFGHPLLERACIKMLKTSKGVHGCKALEDISCNGVDTVKFTLSDAKHAVFGSTASSATAADTVEPSKVTPSADVQATPNPLVSAWHKLIALLTWK